MIENDPDFTKITYMKDGQLVEKYILKSDLETYALTEANVYNSDWYSKDELGDPERLAYASGNGKINYYYTLRKTLNQDWQYYGTGWLDRTKNNSLATFQSNWSYSNGGNDTTDTGTTTNGNGVWRVKELVLNSDGTYSEDGWLDEKDKTKNKFLLRVNLNKPANVYDTAGELLNQLGGYTQISGSTDWKKNDATPYMQVSANGRYYYLPKSLSGITLYDGKDPAPSAKYKIAIKYYDNGTEKDGYADLSGDPKKYYLMYQDDIQGNDTTDNPMFVDELGNVQYRHKRDGSGKEIDKNEDGSVAYETISPTKSPADDPALVKRAIDDAVNELIANYPEEAENLETTADKIAFLKGKDEATYNDKVAEYFERDFPYLLDGTVKFFNKDDFNLASSLFDNFQLVKMTQYSYLNEHDNDRRSINNLFMIEDAERSD